MIETNYVWSCGASHSVGYCDFADPHRLSRCRWQIASRWVPDWDQARLTANAMRDRAAFEANRPAYRRWRRFMDRLGT